MHDRVHEELLVEIGDEVVHGAEDLDLHTGGAIGFAQADERPQHI